MEANELIEDLREQISELESKGEKVVAISGLNRYLKLAEANIKESNEFKKREHEGMLASHAAETQWGTELFKADIEAGKSALHSIIIINGGAVIALMGVMSGLVDKSGGRELASCLANSLLFFGFGVLAGSFGFALRYFSQTCYTRDFREEHSRFEIAGDVFKFFAILLALSGYMLFALAIISSYSAFSSAFGP